MTWILFSYFSFYSGNNLYELNLEISKFIVMKFNSLCVNVEAF